VAVAVIAIAIVIMIGTMDVVATTIIVHMRAAVGTTMTVVIVRGTMSVIGRKPGSVIGSVTENGIVIVDTRALHHPHQHRLQEDLDQHHRLHRRYQPGCQRLCRQSPSQGRHHLLAKRTQP
jgi:hypothetical protein